jgi:hypothetical protein
MVAMHLALLVPNCSVMNFHSPDSSLSVDHLLGLVEQVDAVVDLLLGSSHESDILRVTGRCGRFKRRAMLDVRRFGRDSPRLDLLKREIGAAEIIDGVRKHQVHASGDVGSEAGRIRVHLAQLGCECVGTTDGTLHLRAESANVLFGHDHGRFSQNSMVSRIADHQVEKLAHAVRVHVSDKARSYLVGRSCSDSGVAIEIIRWVQDICL